MVFLLGFELTRDFVQVIFGQFASLFVEIDKLHAFLVGLENSLENIDLEVSVASHADLDASLGQVLDQLLCRGIHLRGKADYGQEFQLVLPPLRELLDFVFSGGE